MEKMNYEALIRKIESRGKGINTMKSDPDEDVCPVCQGTGWEYVEDEIIVGDHVETYKAVRRCTGCNGDHARRVSDALIRADIPEGRSLSDFDWNIYGEDLTKQKAIIDGFIDNFRDFESEGYGLYIHSRIRGSGKTFLASAISGELINRYEASIRFVSASDLIEISKQKSDDGSDPLEGLISCRILVLDDLGQKMTGRDWMTDILFRIIDKRYTKHRVTILTSNVPCGELDLDDRVVDRINSITYKVKLPECCVRTIESNSRKKVFLQKLGIE